MIESNEYVKHIAGIIPVAGSNLDFNMPWADCLLPINKNYHAIERAINTAAIAGCNTIWVVLHRETQPIIRKKVGEWIYDPETIWKGHNVFFNKVEIPIYYIAINPKDRFRRDSFAWSCLYGANVASYVAKKISKWVIPKKFLVVSPYGIVDDNTMLKVRSILKDNKNIMLSFNNKNFLSDLFLPFSFSEKEFIECKKFFKEKYTGDETKKKFSEVFSPIDISSYEQILPEWFYDISNWETYKMFIGTEHNNLCQRPKYMVNHEWWGLVKDK